MRIFVHPSAIAALPPDFKGIRSSPYEETKYTFMALTQPSEDASHEFEYLHRRNATHWRTPGPDNSATEDQKLWDMAAHLRSNAPLDPDVQIHYTETFAALNRMRFHLGRPLFGDPPVPEQ